ncbi:acyl carrier protein [Gluconobacter cerinus]|uniref:acyl carrier protein n=1 Tax=Gluconobacter cerinus TaxID=38307 RepID=UPI001B8B13E4|nr:acyl carrier protein [Gluconobacter cerinus]MBS1033359.1 acyl carrier protein [Gluconobacter cerinus]
MTIPLDRIHRRLVRVFNTIFPGTPVEQVSQATMENTEGWDSLNTLSLFTLAEEEFGIQLGLDLMAEVKTFSQLEALVSQKVG